MCFICWCLQFISLSSLFPTYTCPYSIFFLILQFWLENVIILILDYKKKKKCQGEIFKARRVRSKFWESPCNYIQNMLYSSRTLRDWISVEGFPVKNLEQNAVLPADAGKQLHKRIVHLQVGFGVTRNHIRRFSVHTCKDQSVQSDGKGLVCSPRRNPGLTLRRAESLNYGWLMKFSRKIVNMIFSNFWGKQWKLH